MQFFAGLAEGFGNQSARTILRQFPNGTGNMMNPSAEGNLQVDFHFAADYPIILPGDGVHALVLLGLVCKMCAGMPAVFSVLSVFWKIPLLLKSGFGKINKNTSDSEEFGGSRLCT